MSVYRPSYSLYGCEDVEARFFAAFGFLAAWVFPVRDGDAKLYARLRAKSLLAVGYLIAKKPETFCQYRSAPGWTAAESEVVEVQRIEAARR